MERSLLQASACEREPAWLRSLPTPNIEYSLLIGRKRIEIKAYMHEKQLSEDSYSVTLINHFLIYFSHQLQYLITAFTYTFIYLD